MNEQLPKWLSDAIARINGRTQTIILDTQDKLSQYSNDDNVESYGRGLRIGDTIVLRIAQPFIANAQNMLDDFLAEEYLRNRVL